VTKLLLTVQVTGAAMVAIGLGHNIAWASKYDFLSVFWNAVKEGYVGKFAFGKRYYSRS
jgi:hypothetical protein